MAEGQHHHRHLFHHKKKEEGESACAEPGGVPKESSLEALEKARKEERHEQHMGTEVGAVAAGAFALYEKHESKKDPEHAHRHKIEEEVATIAGVGAGGFSLNEHHNKKEAKEEEELADGKRNHHFF